MENPVINMTADDLMVVHKHTRSLAIHVGTNDSPQKNLVCSFLEDNQDMNAAVIAPNEDHQHLARRVVSFLSAYMRINDADEMRRDILRCIENLQYKHQF
ncbi:hypothetical protein VSS37_14695 [Candidatus Thiothrix sp. Deng01]|uniref:Uncharacterized protein n=1 Tax=Candidatus Thiothrix phosphatis TaxID=3112415 RepID=A0ABU6D1I3_9GAMM|nr:hypothetical protein [Candidatus Thiothrix sp. Deng01]MEB4592237.1 hypothetical protein [Candidatus Thiothrix sp. Deng01]